MIAFEPGRFTLARQVAQPQPKRKLTFQPGQKVLDNSGAMLTVIRQGGPNNSQVWVREQINGWFHPTKLRTLSSY